MSIAFSTAATSNSPRFMPVHDPPVGNCPNTSILDYSDVVGRARGHQPALRAKNAMTAMPMATVPKISCKTLKPRNGIWKSNSVANRALATRTAAGAQRERRHASQAAKPDGSATVRNSHPAGSVQLESPKGLSADTDGVATPARS